MQACPSKRPVRASAVYAVAATCEPASCGLRLPAGSSWIACGASVGCDWRLQAASPGLHPFLQPQGSLAVTVSAATADADAGSCLRLES